MEGDSIATLGGPSADDELRDGPRPCARRPGKPGSSKGREDRATRSGREGAACPTTRHVRPTDASLEGVG